MSDPHRVKVLELASVSLTYGDKKHESVLALENLDLTVHENEFLVVVGQSGCGKSTMLKVMVGILDPDPGQVLHFGQPLKGTMQDAGMVYQNPLLLPWRTIIDNILLPVEILGLDRRKYRERAHELLDFVGLTGFEKVTPRQLSGGMQQRAALCRALITDPSVLLMDEPFAALDALTRDEMARELARLWEHRKKTVVFVTHSIAEAVLLADRVIVMSPRPGKIVRDIPIELARPRTHGGKLVERFDDYVESIRQIIFSFKERS